MLFSQCGQHPLCGLVVLSAKQSRRRNSILDSLNYIYFSSILGLEHLERKNVCFGEKEEVGGLDVKVTEFLGKTVARVSKCLSQFCREFAAAGPDTQSPTLQGEVAG